MNDWQKNNNAENSDQEQNSAQTYYHASMPRQNMRTENGSPADSTEASRFGGNRQNPNQPNQPLNYSNLYGQGYPDSY